MEPGIVVAALPHVEKSLKKILNPLQHNGEPHLKKIPNSLTFLQPTVDSVDQGEVKKSQSTYK